MAGASDPVDSFACALAGERPQFQHRLRGVAEVVEHELSVHVSEHVARTVDDADATALSARLRARA